MRRWMSLALLGLLAAPALAAVKPPQAVSTNGVPPIPEAVAQGLKRYGDARAAVLLDWFGERGLVVQTRFGNTAQLHWVETPMGSRQQMTFSNEPVIFAAIGPDPGHGLVYGGDVGGGEGYQLFHHDPLSANTRQLTQGAGRNTSPVFSNSGRLLAYSTTARNGRDTHIAILSMENGAEQARLSRVGTWYALDFSPDDRKLLVAQFHSVSHIQLFTLDIETGTLVRLDEDALSTSQIAAAFAPDGSGVWFLSDRDSNIRTLRFRKLEDGSVRDFTLGKIAWEIQQFAVSNNGGTIALVANEDGYDRLYMLDVRRNRLTPAPANIAETATRIHSMRFSPDDRQLALSLASPSMPGDVFTLDVRSQKLERWTRSELGSLRYTDLGKPELIHYATFDIDAKTGQRRLIPAFYYKPKGFSGARPVVIQIHGGPESQFRPTFNPLLHYLVNDLGIAVVAPNVRGSSGYGRDWLALDDVFKREDAVRDIGGLLDWIGTRPELDHRRVGVMGGSYGGYMVLASMIQFPQRLKGGVSLVGISNFITFLETTSEYRRHLRRAEYGDETDPQVRAFLGRISPLRQAQRINAPLFIAQGANDPRVPASESRQLLEQVRKNQHQVWYLEAADEGHGFRRKSNRDFYGAVVAEFWRRQLLGVGVDLPTGDPSL